MKQSNDIALQTRTHFRCFFWLMMCLRDVPKQLVVEQVGTMEAARTEEEAGMAEEVGTVEEVGTAEAAMEVQLPSLPIQGAAATAEISIFLRWRLSLRRFLALCCSLFECQTYAVVWDAISFGAAVKCCSKETRLNSRLKRRRKEQTASELRHRYRFVRYWLENEKKSKNWLFPVFQAAKAKFRR